MSFYIAYGSNLNKEQMRYRCPTAKVVGNGYVVGYELIFRLYATIEKSKGKRVPVTIWEIDETCEASLDRYGGCPRFYRKEIATIVAGSICQIVLIVTCCILLVSGSSIRNAAFSLMIASILYIVIVTLLILSIENAEMLDQCIVSPFDGRTDSNHGEIDNREVNSINEAQNAIDVRKLASRTSSPGGDDINLTCNIVPPPLPVRR